MHLSTVIVTKTKSALTVEAVGPEAAKVNISLAELSVSDDQPSTKHGLSKNVKDGISDDFAVNTDAAGTVSETPDTADC